MEQKLEKKLVDKYPLLFKDYHGSPTQTALAFGFECGNGWYNIIDNLGSKLEPLIKLFILEHDEEEIYPTAFQVKEKFGGLRFYMTTSTDEMDKLVDLAEEESYKTCEQCGTKDNVNTNNEGWMVTLCDKCRNKSGGLG